MQATVPGRFGHCLKLGARILASAAAALALAFVPVACGTGGTDSLLSDYLPRFPHQAYGYSLVQTRALRKGAGLDWLAASERAVLEPEPVVLPHRVEGRFDPAEPAAVGAAFSVAPRRRLALTLSVEELGAGDVFVDLFSQADGRLERLASLPGRGAREQGSLERRFELEVLEPASFLVRVQGDLAATAAYRLELDASPLLRFPVSGHDSSAILSGFGAERDGGRRAHRGVDIFAPRGTPALAAVDSFVARVDTTPRGGNVVWLQPLSGSMRLYYAHLDTQLVETGQFVAAGDVIGTVGNTGNAITTPPHLHFGVYIRRGARRGGAQDPYLFLN